MAVPVTSAQQLVEDTARYFREHELYEYETELSLPRAVVVMTHSSKLSADQVRKIVVDDIGFSWLRTSSDSACLLQLQRWLLEELNERPGLRELSLKRASWLDPTKLE
jgi:hypothetical protein